jgi:hypothetical protein
VTSVSVRAAGPARRVRTFGLWLNGRAVTRSATTPQPGRWAASLSATHGLRFGVNRLRVQVIEPDAGRYALLSRRFVVRRVRHLAAAGWDTATRVGGRVRLNGGRSLAAVGGRLQFRWRILVKPPGSRPTLRGVGGARPVLVPDRPGHYVVGLTVSQGSTGLAATRASADSVAVTVAPSSLLVPFKGLTHNANRPGIQVGDTFYPNPSPGGSSMQWLTLDRATLTPTKTGNTWLDGSGASGPHGIGALTSALSNEGLDQLVILSFPTGGGAPPVQSDQIDAFNQAIQGIGVGPIDKGILQDHNKLAIIGVPFGGDGSGWYTHGGGPVDALTGWLMPDATVETNTTSPRFRFQPERPTFDTSSSSTSTTNTMTMRDQRLPAALPPGATGGFQLVLLDPIDFTPTNARAVFATNGVADPASALTAMAKFLNDNGGNRFDMAVQSIGHVKPPAPPSDPYAPDVGGDAWRSVASALSAYGANPDTFNTVGGSYAFLGGGWLARGEVAQSSSAIVTDPTASPPTRESGTLRGRLRIRSDGYFMPVAADPSDSLDFSLYDFTFRPPTPWPYTKAAGDPKAAAYAKALAYISANLPDLQSYAPDLRQAYVANPTLTYSNSNTALSGLRYPGDNETCNADPGRVRQNPGYTRGQFCALVKELHDEFGWLDSVHRLFDAYEQALGRSGSGQAAQLQSIGDTIRKSVSPPPDASIATHIALFLKNLIFIGVNVASGGAAVPFTSGLSAAIDLGMGLASDTAGAPLGDKINTTVTNLAVKASANLVGTANALDRIRQVIISDYGRLKALGTVANTKGWTVDIPNVTTDLNTAADAYFRSELMPVAYNLWYLSPTNFNPGPTTDNCFILGYGHSFRGAPATTQMTFHGSFDGAQGIENQLALGKQTWTASQYAYPPAALTDSMFRPRAQNGDGLYLPDFFWTHYTAPYRTVYCH